MKKMRGMGKKVKFLAMTAILAAAGYAGWLFLSPAKTAYVYRTQPVTRGSITATISATGTVNAVETVDVGTQVSGTIKEIYADYNSPVKKGQLLALLDPDVLSSKVDESNASLALAHAGVKRAEADLTEAKRDNKRKEELWERKLIARSEMEAAETSLLSAEASLAEAKAKVVQARASLKQAQTNLGYTRIVSPIDGVVVSREVEVGQTVAASLQTPTLFSIARDLTKMQIEADIDEADIGRIAEGQPARCKFDAWPADGFEASVVQKRLNPETISNVVTYKVILKVDNAEKKLMPGMTANLSVITERRDGVVRIPAAALRFAPPSDVLASLNGSNSESKGSGGLIAMPPRRSSGNGQADSNAGKTVWLVNGGQLAGSLVIDETGVSDKTWVEVRGEAAAALAEGQELAVSFSRQESGAAQAGMRK